MNQSRGEGVELTPDRAERILMAFANLSGEWALMQHPEADPKAYKRMEAALNRLQSRYSEAFVNCPMIALMMLRDLLRKAWTAPGERAAGWYLFQLRYHHSNTVRRVRHVQTVDGKPEPEILSNIPGTVEEAKRIIEQSEPLPMTEFEASVFYLHKNLRRALYCPNTECPAPYFFANRKNQRFCSPECAKPSRVESQRRWWQENRSKQKRRK